MEIDDFTLFSGAPILYKNLSIRQPILYEIGKIGEREFYNYISYFLLDKDKLIQQSPKKKTQLQKITNTQFMMFLIVEQPDILRKINFIILTLMDRLMTIDSSTGNPSLKLVGKKEEESLILEDDDWNEIINIVKQIFCISVTESKYNFKKGSHASRIAEALKKGKERADTAKNKVGFQPMLSQYCSILSIGSGILLNEIINNYTLYQLMHQMKRFNKYEEYHSQLNAMVHGAKIDKLTSWYGNIDDKDNDHNKTDIGKMSGVMINSPKK